MSVPDLLGKWERAGSSEAALRTDPFFLMHSKVWLL